VNVVIGAGLTGLSAAYHSGGKTLVLEKESTPGGLCRSETVDGFTFDLTGHLLHLRRPEIKDLIRRLLPGDAFNRIDRRSFIYSSGVFTPYPYQVNTHGLPAEVIAECLEGFIEAVRGGEVTPEAAGAMSFRDWVLATFGKGVAKHFMFPYNEKLWRTDLSEMTCEWVSWAVPRPTVTDVVEGALGISRRAFGYNPSFLYPRRGGIRILADAIADRVEGIRYGAEVTAVDARRKVVTFRTREGRVEESPYSSLISTMPLPALLQVTDGLPGSLDRIASGLRYTAVVNINLGIERAPLTDMHWVYFPGPEFLFYRCGFPANFTSEAVPPGCSSLYMEISLKPGEAWSEDDLMEKCRQGLLRCGLLRPEDRIVARSTFYISPAYVIYDRFRLGNLDKALATLRELGIHSTGRYGAWHYNSMEESLDEGRKTVLGIEERL
jgi:protoporphyrinogen oxidase